MACLRCTSVLYEKEQYYAADDMGPEIISVIERYLGNLVDENGVMCSQCFGIIMQQMSNDSALEHGDHELQHHHDSNVCVRCRTSLFRRRTHSIPEGAERQYIAETIAPREIPEGGLVCFPCWLHTRRTIQQQGIIAAPAVDRNMNACVWCRRSLAQTRTHSIPEGPERTIITETIYPREIPPGGLVCYACWVAARRNVERATRSEEIDDTDFCGDGDVDDDDSHTLVESNVCRVCLALDVKMYDLKDIELKEMFQNITGIMVAENNHSILERICWECAGRLKAAAVFRHKALLSDALLQGLANTGEQIRKNDITLIKENKNYLNSVASLSIVEVFHTVEIDAEYEGVPSMSENNNTDISQNTVRRDSIELKDSIIKENNDQMDVEDESMIEALIKTEIEYDPISPNTGEENRNIILETNPLFSNDIPLREDKISSAYSSPAPGCSHVEPKYPIIGYLQTPSDCENKINKTVVKITNRDSISKIVSKKSKEVINYDHTIKGDDKLKNINVRVGGISKKTSNQKLAKRTQVKANTPTDVEYLNWENFEF